MDEGVTMVHSTYYGHEYQQPVSTVVRYWLFATVAGLNRLTGLDPLD